MFCDRCKPFGITCRDIGTAFEFWGVKRIMKIGTNSFSINHPISDCDAVTGKTTSKKLASILIVRSGSSTKEEIFEPDNNLEF